MDTTPPVADLIEKYFDNAASAAERVELEGRLAEPTGVAAFVAAARLNAWLEEVLVEDDMKALCTTISITAGQEGLVLARRPWRQTAIGLALAAAILVAMAVGLRGPSGGRPTTAVVSVLPTGPAPSRRVPSTDRSPPVQPGGDMPIETAVMMFGLMTANAVK